MDDDELLAVAKTAIGERFGLSPQQSARLSGTTRAELEHDARAMRVELGLPPLDEHARDERGRFQGRSMNDAIRQAAGR